MKRYSTISAKWQAILSLSKEILELPSLDSRLQAIQDFVNHLLQCEIEIVLFDSVPGIMVQGDLVAASSSTVASFPASPQAGSDLKGGNGKNEIDSNIVTKPLAIGARALGEIRFFRADLPFSKSDLAIMDGLAIQVSIVIENTRLSRDSEQQSLRLSTISEISNAIASILDLDLLLNSITGLIHKYFNYPYVYLFTVHKWQKKVKLRAGSITEINSDAISFDLDEDENDNLLSQAIESRRAILTEGGYNEPPLSLLPPYEAKSELVVPLVFGEDVLGVLWLRSEQVNSFRQTDVILFETLGDNIAVALRNANLYRSEQWRRQVAESMRDVAGLLSADVDLTHLLNQLLAELTKTLPSETAAIWLVDSSEMETAQLSSPLQLAALLTSNDSIHELIVQLEATPSEEWLEDILESHYPLIRDHIFGDDPLGKLFGYPENYSAIFASLRVGLQPIGILVLADPQPGRYGTESQLIVSTFASYAAVAIKNTQLYEAAHDQAWVSTVLLQMGEATQSIDNLGDLIHTVVQSLPQLVGVDACAILLWDRKVEAFLPFASFGLTPEQQSYFDQWYIFENEVPAFDLVLTSKEPVILTRTLLPNDEEIDLYSALNLESGLFVLFPMISQTDIQGAILVDFSENSAEYDYKLWDEKISIIQGIAHQTAVAVENINLIRSQEEEAYVSIALLQVAQAIVSATEINDVLGVVTRITPILVAMRRCVVFLWDSQRKVYYLSQSYGIARGEQADLPGSFAPDAFPMLQSVRQSNQIACHMIDNDTFSVQEWSTLKPDDYLLINPPTGSDTDDASAAITQELLSSRQNLLLAYPLAIKGNVLGIMVTEEESSGRGTPTYHIRERRMEIVTGITQQAALALQNDILQREALQRERFDREMQLAREIQMNFMPDLLPHLDGWDVDIKWKPARQVGGDYYDVFQLPGGDVGFVIADVADKGMPAALFMTLVRTLLRAAVRDNRPPADALREVNELLVPDAKNGMFVTIIYGVLNLETGEFTYANAGHVPPLLLSHATKDLLELMPSSMALGVLPGINIDQRQVQMQAGDTLVFYTDGVSEAFSPTGDMYGDARLKSLLLEHSRASALEVLDMIVSEVDKFTDSAGMSDDLTLIAICREQK